MIVMSDTLFINMDTICNKTRSISILMERTIRVSISYTDLKAIQPKYMTHIERWKRNQVVQRLFIMAFLHYILHYDRNSL